jgi:hypothetical protein
MAQIRSAGHDAVVLQPKNPENNVNGEQQMANGETQKQSDLYKNMYPYSTLIKSGRA